MMQVEEVIGWIDRSVLDPSGHKVGSVSQIFVDDTTNCPEWAAINTGLFGRRSSFIPIEGMDLEGEDLRIPWDRAQVKDAPQVDDDGDGHLSPEEEVQLYRHYAKQRHSSPKARDEVGREGTADVDGDRDTDHQHDNADDRTQDQNDVKPRYSGTEQPRLRKYVVTEEVHPVSRELLDDSPAGESAK
jgi:hypothetical protein